MPNAFEKEQEPNLFVLDAMMKTKDGMEKVEIVIDRRAEENVMPTQTLEDVEMKPKAPGLMFVAADGGEMGNYGRRDLHFDVKADKKSFTRRP